MSLRISCMLGNLKMDPYEGMKKLAELGVPGVHLSVGGGPFAPENLDAAARKELLQRIRDLGLEISAVSAWGGNVDLCEAEQLERNVEWAQRIMDLALDLDCTIWQAHIGIMPRDTDNPRWRTVVEAAERIAAYGENVGACLAIETGPEPPFVVERLITTIDSHGLRVNYDPANLILWPAILVERGLADSYDKETALRDFEPVEGARRLGKYTVHCHAKDAVVDENGKRQEVPLGQGWVDWPRLVRLLQEAGFDGYWAIERETGADPVGDVTRAVDFLRSL